MKFFKGTTIRRVDIQVSIFTAVVVVISCLILYFFHYQMTYQNMIASLSERVNSIYQFVERELDKETFSRLSSQEDMSTPLYQRNQEFLHNIKEICGVMYLYTAKYTADGSFVYLLDGLNLGAEDFRVPGDPIEPEIVPELTRALSGESVLPSHIKDTGWGKIFIAYLPVHKDGQVIGVVGVEFQAAEQYDTYRALRISTPLIVLGMCLLAALCAVFLFRRISNPTYKDLSNTDQLTQLKNRNAFETDSNNLDARRIRFQLGLIVMDLNRLKWVNDELGHEFGDQYLRLAAQAISESAPENAVAYRIGGDEFLLLCYHADYEALRDTVIHIQDKLELVRPQDWPVAFSLSAGCALFEPETDSSLSQTLRRADAEMYLEKQAYHLAGTGRRS